MLSAVVEWTLRTLLSIVYWRPMRYYRFRQVAFDTAPAGKLLITAQAGETYVVAPGDRVIGRGLFMHGEFDFDKLIKVVGLLDDGWSGDLLIDVGANIGSICIPAVRRGYFARAIAVEPEPFNYSLLMANIHLNNLASRITPMNVAFGSQDHQELEFDLSPTNFGDHRVRVRSDTAPAVKAASTIAVRSETFDSTIGEIDPRKTLIWIDTQGFEGYVLSGAARALSRRAPVVIEFWPQAMRRSDSYSLVKNALLTAGYEQYRDLDSGSAWMPLDPAALDRLYADLEKRGPYAYTDLLIR